MRQLSSGSAVALLVTALVLGGTSSAAHAQTATATDLDFIRRVHLTVASVSPATALARQVSAHAAVKTLAARVSGQIAGLDRLSRSTAAALKVSLTGPLPPAEQAALAILQSHTGAEFETEYVNYLWAADSTLLPISMTVHGATGNTAVRQLADRADTVLAAQLPLLQQSGLLHMAVLPAASPAAATTRLPGGVPPNQGLEAQARSGGGFLSPTLPVRLFVLVAALGAAGGLIWRLRFRSTSAGRRRRRGGPETTGTADARPRG